MLNITKDNKSYYFDFQVSEYPSQQRLQELVQPLDAAGETPWSATKNGGPYGKYVCISENKDVFQAMRAGTEEQNWSEIVNRLSVAPMQFSRDAFWRLKGPYLEDEESATAPIIEDHIQKGKARQSRAIYHFVENLSWKFEIVSEIAAGVEPREPFSVEGTSSDEKAVKLIGNTQYPVRRYTGTIVECRSETAKLMGPTAADLTFATSPQPTGWASGARFTLKFRVNRNRLRLIIGIGSAIVAAAAFALADSKLLEPCLWASPLLKFCAFLSAGFSGFALTGKITFSK